MKAKEFSRTPVYFLFLWLILLINGALFGQVKSPQLPPADVQFMGADGKIITGIRCGAQVPSQASRGQIRRKVALWLAENNYETGAAITVIPVAFHIVRHNDGSADVTDQQINDQLKALNASFAISNFQFSLHSIERVNNSAWSAHIRGSQEETDMKQALAVDPAQVLNFYTADLGGWVLGYARFPWEYPEDSFMHGVVCRYATLPGGTAFPYDEGNTGVHEVGHYTGLYHTWGDGPCGVDDEVADTSGSDAPNYGRPTGRASCGSVDMAENFMDYTDDAYLTGFTPGQSERIDQQMAIYHPSMLQEIVEVTLHQKLSDGQTEVGTIGRWDGNDFEPRFSPPQTFSLTINSTEVFHGDSSIYSGEKYNRWNEEPDVTNHHEFTIDENFPNILTAKFEPTRDGITLQNYFLNAPGSNGGTIDFKDPWLIDYPDPNYGNNVRNRDISAPFKSRPSPFNPDYTTSYNGDKYLGVFLNENPQFDPSKPIYSVQAVDGQPLTVNGKSIIWDWKSWNYNPAEIDLQTPGSNTTAVVFKQDNATLSANLKGRRTSDTPEATAGNNASKIVAEYKTSSSHNPQNLYQVYVDRGKVFFTESTDGGSNWSKDYLIDGSTQYQCLNPGVGVDRNLQVYIAYERKYTGGGIDDYTVHHIWRDSQGIWSATEDLSAFPYGGYNNPTTPSIYVEYTGDVYVVWQYTYNFGGIIGGIVLRHKDYLGANWTTISEVPGTDAESYTPAVSYGDIGTSSNNTHITWRDGAIDDIMFITGDYDYQTAQWNWSSATNLTGGVYSLFNNARPSIHQNRDSSDPDYIYVTWQATDNSSAMRSAGRGGCIPSLKTPAICFREKAEDVWQPLHIFEVCNSGDRNPVATSFIDDENDLDALIAFQSDDAEISRIWRWSGSWTPPAVITGDGVNPALTTLDEYQPLLAYTEKTSAPYRVQLEENLTYELEAADSLPHSRLVTFQISKAIGGNGLDGNIVARLGDPELLNAAGRRFIAPQFKNSLLTPENAFRFKIFKAVDPGDRLRIPVGIFGSKITRSPGERLNGRPMLGLRIKNAAGNQVLKKIYTYLTGIIGNDSSFVVTDTLEVDLSEFRGKHIFAEGKFFFRNKQHGAQVAEVYDLRNTNPGQQILSPVSPAAQTALFRSFRLYQNYPNPFNPGTTIQFNLPQESKVSLRVYNIKGELVNTLVNRPMAEGNHSVAFDASHLASGIYLYRIHMPCLI